MAFTLKNRLYLGFTLAIVLCAASCITSYLILQQQTQRVFLRKTRSIIDTTTNLQIKLIDMETGRRGFRATDQKRFLAPYDDGLQHLNATIIKLRALVADSPVVSKTEADLEQQINILLAFWKHNGDDASSYSREYITRLTDDEKTQMDKVRTLFTQLQKDETKSMAAKREDYDRMVHFGTLSSSIDSIISEIIIIVLIIIIFREFRSRTKIQEQLHNTVVVLEQQTDTLQTSEGKLKKAMDELGVINKQLEKFVYTVAHDIKSPLSGIIGALYVMRSNNAIMENPELKQFADLSHNAGLHLSKMVDSLLEYSTLSIRQQPAEPVNIQDLLEQMAALLFPPKNIDIRITAGMPVMNTRKLKIEQVFQNLISNAIKYNGREHGVINIGVEDKGAYYQFYVQDNGQGISESDKDKIFSLLGTSDNTSSADTSTGFGLGIVKLIIEEQGGKIWYDSVKGQGSTFYFEWMK